MRDYIQIYTTTDKDNADLIAADLVDKKLAACVQVAGPIKSIFRFKGKIEEAKEYLCIIKTERRFFSLIEKSIKDIHSYELPEIVAAEIAISSRDYAGWLSDSLQ
jgi:periplasmic divalent cation tolerance protein